MKNPEESIKEDVIKFGTHLRKLREERKLSQQELADMSNIGLSTYLRIENGKAMAKIDTLFTIAKALEISNSNLFEF